MNESTSGARVRASSERSGAVAAVFVIIHTAIWLGSFMVAAAITGVTRTELWDAALPIGPLTLRYMQFANVVAACHPLGLVGLSLVLAAVDFAVLYAVGGRSRSDEVARGLWSALVTVTPLVALALALIALDLPFRAITMGQAKVFDQQRKVESHLKDQLIGTWAVTGLRKAGEAGSRSHAPLTLTFSRVEGTYPDLRAESSDESVLLSGNSWVTYRGNGARLHLGDGKQLCVAPLDPGERMTLWVAPPSAVPDDHQPTENVTVLTLGRRPRAR